MLLHFPYYLKTGFSHVHIDFTSLKEAAPASTARLQANVLKSAEGDGLTHFLKQYDTENNFHGTGSKIPGLQINCRGGKLGVGCSLILCKIQPHIGWLEKYKNVRQTQTNYIQSEQTGGKLHVEPSSGCRRDASERCAAATYILSTYSFHRGQITQAARHTGLRCAGLTVSGEAPPPHLHCRALSVSLSVISAGGGNCWK